MMIDTLIQLQRKFESLNISPESYSFDGYKEDALCVSQTDIGKWEVYEGNKFERKGNLRTFTNEKNVCTYFLKRARELKIVTKDHDIELPLLVKDLNPLDKTPHFINVVDVKNSGSLSEWSPHEQCYRYKLDDELIADVETVVRCKHCKHKRISGIGTLFCVHPNGLKKIEDDTYCCHGDEN